MGRELLLEASVSTNIRVLIRDMPPLMRDVIEYSISTQADIEILEEGNLDAPSVPTVTAAPDVVIVGTMHGEHGQKATGVLLKWPRAQVLMIGVDGHVSAFYELTLRKSMLGEMSPAELVDAIRASVERSRAAAIWGKALSH